MLPKQHIADLGFFLRKYGLRHVVICPGSRNAPLIQLFTADTRFHCHSIVDERSAAYVAMGMARTLGEPVAVVTTSGTAALNLAPGVAESFYQEIPLILLTADRLPGAAAKKENQAIRQRDIYIQNSKAAFSLPVAPDSDEELEAAGELMDGAIRLLTEIPKGPVQINIPLEEPLYETLPPAREILPSDSQAGKAFPTPEKTEFEDLAGSIEGRKKILILPGMYPRDPHLSGGLGNFASRTHALVLCENLSNLCGPGFAENPETFLAALSASARKNLIPDLVITFGGQMVSKRIRKFLNECTASEFWHIGTGAESMNPYSNKGRVICGDPAVFFSTFPFPPGPHEEPGYAEKWREHAARVNRFAGDFIRNHAFGNLAAMQCVLEGLPEGTALHLGNSGAVRYAQFFPARPSVTYFANRGTSGIDGCLSAAVGAAMVSGNLHLAVLGDLSFVYDSNAMWNENFPPNLKIIVLNDAGGGIFRIIEGPDRMPFLEEYAVTRHPVSPGLLASAFGLDHRMFSEKAELLEYLPEFFAKRNVPEVMEIDTAKYENSTIFKALFKNLEELHHDEQGMESDQSI